ncbi:glycosyltransferase [uncultured Cohaesibacter sp.]|uniref:glycosyltransferase n=1 Tax=uncultured Cohaesibacter sp. TaxID=1002546 RepID=UPI0029C83912|nr:glycosyltransferase [uncultured Cohaesibacter sp.]
MSEAIILQRDLAQEGQTQGPESLPFHLSLLCRGRLTAEKIGALSSSHQRAHSNYDLASHWIRTGRLSERLYFHAAAQRLGVPYLEEAELEALHDVSPDQPLDALETINCRIMKPRVTPNDLALLPESYLVCAPQGEALDLLEAQLKANPALRQRIRLTSPSLFLSTRRDLLSDQALRTNVYRLRQEMPQLSSHHPARARHILYFLFGVGMVLAGSLWSAPLAVLFNLLSVFIFVSISSLRLLAWLRRRTVETMRRSEFEALLKTAQPDQSWPSYSLLVPLYREAAVVTELVAALSRIDYPADKLTIMLLVEADDEETRAALTALDPPPLFSIVTIPVDGPRTKPKALNYALSFVSSELVAVYDAEDRPHPLQLREAALRMQKEGASIGCLQGRLAIDNLKSGFFSQQFAVEYAALFDGLLPFLSAEKLPVPLGGTSNHFPTAVLREVGAWDPFNVTEDADLGMRLTRLGYHIGILQTDTWEEAPVQYGAWLKQRTRWFKGWMQTWLVHMREPRRLWQEMGPLRFLAFQVLIGGMLVSALIHPVYFITFALAAVSLLLHSGTDATFYWLLMSLNSFNLFLGYGSMMLLAHSATAKRYGFGWRHVLSMPLYWLAMTPAAWRALFQLIFDPHRWEKTEHGVDKRPPLSLRD